MKAMYGVNRKGEMTPCHAKNPETCPYHVDHQMRDAAEVQRFNEELAKTAMRPRTAKRKATLSRKTVSRQVQLSCIQAAEEKLDEYHDYLKTHLSATKIPATPEDLDL